MTFISQCQLCTSWGLSAWIGLSAILSSYSLEGTRVGVGWGGMRGGDGGRRGGATELLVSTG